MKNKAKSDSQAVKCRDVILEIVWCFSLDKEIKGEHPRIDVTSDEEYVSISFSAYKLGRVLTKRTRLLPMEMIQTSSEPYLLQRLLYEIEVFNTFVKNYKAPETIVIDI